MLRYLVLLAVVCLVWPAGTLAQFDTKPAGSGAKAPELGESKTSRWEFGAIISASGGPCAGLLGTFPVPGDWPEQQVKIVDEQISPAVRRANYRQTDGLKQMVFEIPQLPAAQTASCLITFEVTKSAQQAPSDTSGFVIPKNPPRDVRQYLGASPHIEATNAKIKQFAKQLTTGKEGAWAQVEALCDGVRERVRYQVESKDVYQGAVATLREGKADKEDMTALFVALCRAHKVPARMVWVLDFCYAEFYLDDAEGKGHWLPCRVHEEKEFGYITDRRPILAKGDNFKVPEKKEPQWFVAEFLTGKGGGGQPQVEFRRKTAQ
jgi:transglutaminase-like putative cysteine protease